jgi:hypothetical protein
MKKKHIILMILALAGMCLFTYPLIQYWYAGADIFVILATMIGVPMVGIGTWLRRLIDQKKVAAIKSGRRSNYGWPLFETFSFFVGLFIITMVFTTLPVYFFLGFIYATLAGGFGWWFIQTWQVMRSPENTK